MVQSGRAEPGEARTQWRVEGGMFYEGGHERSLTSNSSDRGPTIRYPERGKSHPGDIWNELFLTAVISDVTSS